MPFIAKLKACMVGGSASLQPSSARNRDDSFCHFLTFYMRGRESHLGRSHLCRVLQPARQRKLIHMPGIELKQGGIRVFQCVLIVWGT